MPARGPFAVDQAPQAVLFDLDGTLIDSAPSLARAVDVMLGQLQRPAAGEARVRDWVGNGARVLVHRALTEGSEADVDPALLERAHGLFLQAYGEAPEAGTLVYPGVRRFLDALRRRGLPLGLITNKPAAFIPPLLKSFELEVFFALTLGGDSLAEKKPHPAPLLHAARHFGVAPGRCLMVGDSRHDIEAARRAGCPVAAVSYGYNHGEPVGDAAPDWVVDSLPELL
ncbi:phosphoglycolate phosphatase [Motiliproteus sp. SC1-56]|uniref:phosphoglycolate phosphatase n=1 Tax=Motiliproteus sp. SC1-56 TaxID=2799565 RepID=UPI001A905FD9|nr:phosphoglycolate phosphatase [Motiliproteus sp. SC1-56]